jgi:hypothetical protein
MRRDGHHGTAITVSCSHGTLDAPSQSVDSPAVPIKTIFTITADGITELVKEYGERDFKHVAVPFTSWMTANHQTDMSSIEFGSWSTIEEAKEVGESVAAFSQQWADYLTANGCNYLDNC